MKASPRFIAPLVAISALTLGVLLAAVFIITAPKTERRPPPVLPPRVVVETIVRENHPAMLQGLGTVVAAQSVAIQAEVSGVVRTLHPQLMPGGTVQRGEPIVRIDPRNYRVAVKQAQAAVAQARVTLRLEQGRQRVAKKEWALLADSTSGEADEELALRRPQLANAEAALTSAQSALERAELDLSRTMVRAPFDAFIQSESVELGQLVGPGTPLAQLVGTDRFWVQVSLPPSQLRFLNRVQEAQAKVKVEEVVREGKVVRVLGDLDPRGKMARVLVEVSDPMGLQSELDPLLLGSVAEVEITGQSIQGVFEIPRTALRQDREVWVVRDNKLAIVPVDVAWRGQTRVFVRSEELPDRAQFVVSRMSAPVQGMSVRLEQDVRPEGVR